MLQQSVPQSTTLLDQSLINNTVLT